MCSLFGNMADQNIRTPSKQSIGRKNNIGKCELCAHMGCIYKPCKQCFGSMRYFSRYEYDSEDEDGEKDKFDFSNYTYCFECKRAKKDQEYCHVCFRAGTTVKTGILPDKVKEDMIQQKSLPRCALETFNKCRACYETANYFSSQLRPQMNMASCALELVREYECMVESGLVICFQKIVAPKPLQFALEPKPVSKKHRFKIDPTNIDITPKTLKGLIEHHHKFCLCSICKWCIITGLI